MGFFCTLRFDICPESHIITLYTYPAVIVHRRPVRTDWTGVGVSCLLCTVSLLMRSSVPSWGLRNLQYALGPGWGSVDAFSVVFNSYPFPCDTLSQILLNYSTMCWDLSALHCGHLCHGRCGAEIEPRHPTRLLDLCSSEGLTRLEIAPWFKSTLRCTRRMWAPWSSQKSLVRDSGCSGEPCPYVQGFDMQMGAIVSFSPICTPRGASCPDCLNRSI